VRRERKEGVSICEEGAREISREKERKSVRGEKKECEEKERHKERVRETANKRKEGVKKCEKRAREQGKGKREREQVSENRESE